MSPNPEQSEIIGRERTRTLNILARDARNCPKETGTHIMRAALSLGYTESELSAAIAREEALDRYRNQRLAHLAERIIDAQSEDERQYLQTLVTSLGYPDEDYRDMRNSVWEYRVRNEELGPPPVVFEFPEERS